MLLGKKLTCLRAIRGSIAAAILTMLAPAVSDAGEADPGRYPRRFSPARKPISVPSEFVLTRAGFMHPSCVITIHSDEVASPDGDDVVIRGPDGTERFRSGPCAYPRYGRDGELTALAKIESGATADAGTRAQAQAQRAAYDGWICSYQGEGSFDPGSTLVTEWYVPALPTNSGAGDIALFNDIVTTAGGGDILQPVLDLGQLPNQWAIESEHCCIGGNDIQSDLVPVSPGDLIRGTVAPSNCDDSGTCANWTITTLDVTTGRSTITNTTETSGRAYAIHPGALESYGITSCDMLPANGEATFFNNALTSPSGTTYSLDYSLQVISSREQGSGLPLDCGYDGTMSDESFTLIWQETHYPINGAEGGGGMSGDAGVGGAAGSDGGLGEGGAAGTDGPLAGSGGAAGSGGNVSSGGSSAAGGTNAAGGGTSLGGAAGAGPSGGSGGSAGGGNGGSGGSAGLALGSGGTSAVQSSGGTSGQVDMVAPGGSSSDGSSSDGKGGAGAHADAGTAASASSMGCSCTVGQSRSASWLAWLLAVALVLGQLRRSRRR